ncbi:MAG: 3-phosphoshikimate 1-carboxyvinyltransferase [Dethiobacteraceae bacterium]|jgi:3-phosphoshikimate 1-carboxyvinyltransferase|nr:3-phosphoshikimate 1-carboxyvinyltransferase [Bacillota bacterium]
MQVTISAQGPLQGTVQVPGDKSISHRAAILGALAEGETTIEGFLPGDDCLATVTCLRQLGVPIIVDGQTVQIQGVGLTGLREPEDVLNCGNSGTTARLLLGVLAAQPFSAVLTGDASLRQRPMGRVTEPLRSFGAHIVGRQQGQLLPLTCLPGKIRGGCYRSPVASAQVKSALLLAGLFSSGMTQVSEPYLSRDHTERLLACLGADISVQGTTVTLQGSARLRGRLLQVPGDLSAAAYFLVAASIVPGSELLLPNVGINPSRTGLLTVLQAMGGKLQLLNRREINGEPRADLLVRSAPLRGVEISGALIPKLIDELPVLAAAALFAGGKTIIRDAQELRVKETDRLAAVAEEFSKLGAVITPTADGLIIDGPQQLQGGTVDSRGDHRMAMSLAVAALRAAAPVTITGAEAVAISYPHFWETLQSLQRS